MIGLIKKNLNNKLIEIGKIEYINHGGCGFIAYGIKKFLKKRRIDSKIIFLFNDRYYLNKAKNDFEDYVHNGENSCDHVMALIDDKLFDTEGIHDLNGYPNKLEIKEEDFIKILNDGRRWNSTFDRTNINKIEKILKISLSLS